MIVGVTGGIGAGKSSACQVFKNEGALVINADLVGYKVVADPSLVQELVEIFGQDILDGKKRISRRELGRKAFASKSTVKILNGIVWPRLLECLKEKVLKALAECPDRPVVIDAALLIEWGDPRTFCDLLVVVTADGKLRNTRTMERLGISEREVNARMALQMPEEEKILKADYIILNNGSREELEIEAQRVWRNMVNSLKSK